MSSLKARVKEQLQLYLKFLGSNDVVLKTTYLPMKVEEGRSSLKLFLQKLGLKENPKNRNKINIRGNTNSIINFAKTKFEDQSRTCRGASRSTKTKFEKSK
jgi:hypothetical protein